MSASLAQVVVASVGFSILGAGAVILGAELAGYAGSDSTQVGTAEYGWSTFQTPYERTYVSCYGPVLAWNDGDPLPVIDIDNAAVCFPTVEPPEGEPGGQDFNAWAAHG